MASNHYRCLKYHLCFALCCFSLVSAQHIGSPNIEYDLTDRDDIIYFTDFESESWGDDWDSYNHRENTKLVNTDAVASMVPFHGNALEVTIREGEHYGTSIKFMFNKKLGYEPEELYVRYYTCFADDWPGYHGKAPGFDGTYNIAGWGGKPVDGTNGWSARGGLDFNDDNTVRMNYYVYHADMTGTYGNSWFFSGAGNRLETGRWYCVEQYCKLNVPGQNNGVLRAWIDGEQVYEKTDLRMRDVDYLKLFSYWIDYYWGGLDVATHDCHVYLDNLVMATDARVGSYSEPVSVRHERIKTGESQRNRSYRTILFPFNTSRPVVMFEGPHDRTSRIDFRTAEGSLISE